VAQQHYQKSADAQCFPAPDFKVGDKVFVKAQFFRTTRPSKKLSEKYLGPYEIIAQPGTLSFTLHLLESMCSVHPVFHVSMLKPATSNTFSEKIQPAPAPVIIDREPEYEISQIVDSKIDRRWACKLLYKVIWLVSRPSTVDFIHFYFLSFILLFFSFIFYFLFLEQLRLGVISHTVTSVTNRWHSHKTDHGTWKNGVEGTRKK